MTAVVIGYARVSTENQTLDLQRDALTRAGCTRIYEDRMRGAKAARLGLPLALEVARTGDRLVVWRLDRLSRSMSRIPHEALISLRHRLETLPERHPDRQGLIASIAALYGLSRVTLDRGLQRERRRGNEAAHAERQRPASFDSKRDTHLEDQGAETPDGPVRLRRGLLSKATANRYLKHRGGVAYQEYHCVRGEDIETGSRFLFNAMAPKPEEDGSSFQGIPAAICSTSRLIIKSAVFNRVMEHLGARDRRDRAPTPDQ